MNNNKELILLVLLAILFWIGYDYNILYFISLGDYSALAIAPVYVLFLGVTLGITFVEALRKF